MLYKTILIGIIIYVFRSVHQLYQSGFILNWIVENLIFILPGAVVIYFIFRSIGEMIYNRVLHSPSKKTWSSKNNLVKGETKSSSLVLKKNGQYSIECNTKSAIDCIQNSQYYDSEEEAKALVKGEGWVYTSKGWACINCNTKNMTKQRIIRKNPGFDEVE